MRTKNDFINFMIEAGVLTFGDFTTKSGRKTPYFVNTGNYKTGKHISVLGDYYADLVADNIKNKGEKYDALYGPAYKGITLVSAAAGSLYRNHDIDIPFFFNRKETKDHGEGGIIIGYKPKDGDQIGVIEDVVTAGTAIRETLELFKSIADINIKTLYVSVDRMERGKGELSTLNELSKEHDINICAIINAHDIIDSFPVDDERKTKMEAYLKEYGAASAHRSQEKL